MIEKRVNRNAVIIEAVKNICTNCKTCVVPAIDIDSGKNVIVKARYCLDGSGYIDIDIYDENNKYMDCCKLKNETDPCMLPFNLEIYTEPNCGCR